MQHQDDTAAVAAAVKRTATPDDCIKAMMERVADAAREHRVRLNLAQIRRIAEPIWAEFGRDQASREVVPTGQTALPWGVS